MNLAEAQRLFWRCVRYDPAPSDVEETFAARGVLTGRERMAIYRRMYWIRQVDALWESYPRLLAWMGEKAFTELASAYLAAHPSEHPALERVGRLLPGFVRRQPHLGPVAADLAELEWLELLALLAPDPARLATPAEIAPESFGAARLRMVPSLQALRVGVSSFAHWQSSPPAPLQGQQDVALWRPRFAVEHALMELDEAQALAQARRGAVIAQVCEVFTDVGAMRAHTVLASWFERGWIAEVTL